MGVNQNQEVSRKGGVKTERATALTEGRSSGMAFAKYSKAAKRRGIGGSTQRVKRPTLAPTTDRLQDG